MELEEALTLIEEQKSVIESSNLEFAAIKAKNEELLGETKKAKQKSRDEAELLAKSQAEKAEKENDHEQLLTIEKSRSEKLAAENAATTIALKEAIEGFEKSTHQRKVSDYGVSFNPVSAFALSDLSQRLAARTKMVGDDMRVLDSSGELTSLSLEDLKSEISASGEIAHLVRGNQASGGDALGGSQTANNPTMTSVQKIASGLSKL
tara:strand:- start:1 stop:621 length:621 start_codon:yes stop_codon:yes gene_type:complete